MVRELELNPTDLQALTRLMNQWDDLPGEITYEMLSLQAKKIMADTHRSTILLAQRGADIAGYACLTVVDFLGLGSFVEVQSILVDKEHRHSGVGKSLMAYAEEWAKKRGYHRIMLSSRVHLEQAHAFYKSLGYTLDKQSYFFSRTLT